MSDLATSSWVRMDAWPLSANPGRYGRAVREAGVKLTPLHGFSLATVIVRPEYEAALRQLIADRFGLALPDAGGVVSSAEAELVWSAPGQWLVVGSRSSLDDLPALCAGVAAVTDQSDARALVGIKGANAREALSKGFSIDLHPKVFSAGSSAVTGVAHVAVQIWQVDDTPAFVMSVPRSFAEGVWAWLLSAAGAYGCEVVEVLT